MLILQLFWYVSCSHSFCCFSFVFVSSETIWRDISQNLGIVSILLTFTHAHTLSLFLALHLTQNMHISFQLDECRCEVDCQSLHVVALSTQFHFLCFWSQSCCWTCSNFFWSSRCFAICLQSVSMSTLTQLRFLSFFHHSSLISHHNIFQASCTSLLVNLPSSKTKSDSVDNGVLHARTMDWVLASFSSLFSLLIVLLTAIEFVRN